MHCGTYIFEALCIKDMTITVYFVFEVKFVGVFCA